jgi:hypothetical protein
MGYMLATRKTPQNRYKSECGRRWAGNNVEVVENGCDEDREDVYVPCDRVVAEFPEFAYE